MRQQLVIVLALLVAVGAAHAGPRGANFVTNPGFEAVEGGLAAGWQPTGQGYTIATGEGRGGGNCLYFAPASDLEKRGARQVIDFDPPIMHPVTVSGWGRSAGAEGIDFDVWLDVHYSDGTPLWGQRASFNRGTHDWQYAEYTFRPDKPIARIEVFALFREMKGVAWIDDVRVALAPFELGRVQVLGGLTGPGSVEVFASASMPARWRVEVVRDGSVLATKSGAGQSQRMSFSPAETPALLPAGPCQVRIAATDEVLGERITQVIDTDTSAPPDRGYGLWTELAMTRVMPVDLPTADPTTRVELLAARNEYESAQIVLLPGAAPLRGVTLGLPELRGPGGATIPAANLQWHQVGYVWVEQQWRRPDVPQYAPTWWPDPLLPVERFDVDPGWSQPVWVTACVPPGAAPGTYAGEITVRAEGHLDRRVPIAVRVIDFEIPVAGHARNAFALHQGYLEQVYGRENVTRELRWAYGDYLLAHRINPDDITRAEPPFVEDIAHYCERGLTTYCLINYVMPRGDAPARIRTPLERYTPELRESVAAVVDPVVDELRARGLLEGAYVYSFDECDPESFGVMRDWFGMVHERWGVPTFTTAHVPLDPEALRDLNIDWICPHAQRYRSADARRCQEAGYEVWFYTCCGPRYPFTNIMADDPLIAARLIGWQMYREQLDGFLFWGVNVWGRRGNEAPIDLSKGPRLDWSICTGGTQWAALQGDGVLLYPLPEGPMGCIRLDNIRDGFEDYEYLWALEQARGDSEAVRALTEPVTRSLTDYTYDPRVVLERRERIAEALAAATQ